MSEKRGFSLIELIVSYSILAIAVLSLLQVFGSAARLNQKARKDEIIHNAAGTIMEQVKGLNLNELFNNAKAGDEIKFIKNGEDADKESEDKDKDTDEDKSYHVTRSDSAITLDKDLNSTIYDGDYKATVTIDRADSRSGENSKNKLSELNNYKNPLIRDVSANDFILAPACSGAAIEALSGSTEGETDSHVHRYLVFKVTSAQTDQKTADVTVQWREVYTTRELSDTDRASGLTTISPETVFVPSNGTNYTWYSTTKSVPLTQYQYDKAPLADSVIRIYQDSQKNPGAEVCPIEYVSLAKSDVKAPVMVQFVDFSEAQQPERLRNLMILNQYKAESRRLQADSSADGVPWLYEIKVTIRNKATAENDGNDEDEEYGKAVNDQAYSITSTKLETGSVTNDE